MVSRKAARVILRPPTYLIKTAAAYKFKTACCVQFLQPAIQSCLLYVAPAYNSGWGLIQLGFIHLSEFLLVLNLSSLLYNIKHTKAPFLCSSLSFHFIGLFFLTVKKWKTPLACFVAKKTKRLSVFFFGFFFLFCYLKLKIKCLLTVIF